MAQRPAEGNGVIRSHWSRVWPSRTISVSIPGFPFSCQIAPVIDTAARNRELRSHRLIPPCASMARRNRSFTGPSGSAPSSSSLLSRMAHRTRGKPWSSAERRAELSTGAHAELVEHLRQVPLDSPLAEEELCRDVRVPVEVSGEPGDLSLLGR